MFSDKKAKPKVIQRILSTIIALTLLITTIPSESLLADNPHQANSGGGAGSMGTTSDYKAWSAMRQGYRFYIVNTNLAIESNVVDFIFSPVGVADIKTDTRYGKPDGYSRNSIKQLADWSGSTPAAIPYPTTSRQGQGEEFKNWFLGGMSVNTLDSIGSTTEVIEGTNADVSQSSASGVTGDRIIIPGTLRPVISKKPVTEINNGKAILAQTSVNFQGIESAMRRSTINNWIISHYDQFNSIAQSAKNVYALTKAEAGYYAVNMYHIIVRASGFSEEEAVYICKALYDGYKSSSLVLSQLYYTAQNPTSNSLLDTSIPLDGSYPIETLLKKKEFCQAINLAGYTGETDHLWNALMSGEHLLVIEPLVWLYVATSPATYGKTRTYGSYYNIIQEWNGSDSGGFYATYLTKLGNNCLQVIATYQGENGIDINACTDTGKKSVSDSRNMMATSGDNPGMYGLSMHVYGGSSTNVIVEGGTHTYDVGWTPGRAPDPTRIDDPNKDVVIVKHYVTRDKNGSETVDGTWTRTVNPHTIKIEDEPEYKVEDWFTSKQTDKTAYTGANDKHKWSKLKENKTGTLSGTTPWQVVLPDNEHTLYVKLVREEGDPDEIGEGNYSWELTESQLSRRIVQEINGTDGPVTYLMHKLKDICLNPTHTYTQYYCNVPNDEDHVIGYNEDGSAIYGECSKYEGKDGSKGCVSKQVKDDDGKCQSWTITNSTLSFKRMNDSLFQYSSATAQAGNKLIAMTGDNYFKDIVTYKGSTYSSDKTQRTNLDAHTDTLTYTYDFVLYRGIDQVTICDYDSLKQTNNETTGKQLAAKLFQTSQYVSNKSRLASGSVTKAINFRLSEAEGETARTTKSKGLARYEENGCTITDVAVAIGTSEADNLLKAANEADGSDTGTDTDGSDNESGMEDSNFDPVVNGRATIYTYAGKEQGDLDITTAGVYKESIDAFKDLMPSGTGYNDETSGVRMCSGGSITFNPYINMSIQSTYYNNEKIVRVLSEWERTVVPDDFAEIQWYSKDENLAVNSNMWSMTAAATNGAQTWNQPNQVLKGGATYTLSTPTMQKVYVNTYQTIVDGKAMLISELNSNDNAPKEYELIETSALAEHASLVAQTQKTLDDMKLVMWASGNLETTKNAWTDTDTNNQIVDAGTALNKIKSITGTDKASTEKKYYLQGEPNSQDSNRADLDAMAGDTSIAYYRIYSDAKGDIYLKKGSDLQGVYSNEDGAVKILGKTQNDVSSMTDSTAKKLENRTKAISKFIGAIERNTGDDKNASWASDDGHWYNEAYAGIVVMVQSTPIEVGIKNSQRMTVLDPKLTPVQNSKYDSSSVEAVKLQYKCSNTEGNIVGTFKGQGVKMKDMDRLFTSKKFYAVRGTVSDNN